jgi:hypothetical protein
MCGWLQKILARKETREDVGIGSGRRKGSEGLRVHGVLEWGPWARKRKGVREGFMEW